MAPDANLWVKLADWEAMQNDVRRYRNGYGEAMEQAAMAYDACARLAREVVAADKRERKLHAQLTVLLQTVDGVLVEEFPRETEAVPDPSVAQRHINRLKTDRVRAIDILQGIVPHVGPEAQQIVERFLKSMDETS